MRCRWMDLGWGFALGVTACGGSGATGEGTGTSGAEAASSSSGVIDPSTTVTPTTGEESTSTSTSTGDGSSSTSTSDDSSSTGDGTTGAPIDCAAIPQGPLTYTIKNGPKASEDLAFDHEGNLIGALNGDLFKSPFDGPPQLWVPGAGGFVAGLRANANGMIVYNDTSGTMFRINPQGAKEPVLSGLEYANGLEVDLLGFVYVAEQYGGRVRRIDPATGEFTILAEGLDNPNGLSFSPDYRKLYVGSFSFRAGTITAIDLDEQMVPTSVYPFKENIGGGELDGMAVDACGNVYVCEYAAAIVWRISPDGVSMNPLVNFGQDTWWIPNMQWGSGVGGWDRETLYVLDLSQNRQFEVVVGVPDKPRAYP
jgi:sugar lactone lactonase YvrE